jgi:iron-sulfur cluster assembly protein
MITLTTEAAGHVRGMIGDRGPSSGLRFGVKESGCSGYAYVLDVAAEPGAEDLVHEEHGIKVFIAQKDLPFLRGSIIVFKDDLLETGLSVENPNARRSCGCGASFDV